MRTTADRSFLSSALLADYSPIYPQPAAERQAGQEQDEDGGAGVYHDETNVMRAAPGLSIRLWIAGVLSSKDVSGPGDENGASCQEEKADRRAP